MAYGFARANAFLQLEAPTLCDARRQITVSVGVENAYRMRAAA